MFPLQSVEFACRPSQRLARSLLALLDYHRMQACPAKWDTRNLARTAKAIVSKRNRKPGCNGIVTNIMALNVSTLIIQFSHIENRVLFPCAQDFS